MTKIFFSSDLHVLPVARVADLRALGFEPAVRPGHGGMADDWWASLGVEVSPGPRRGHDVVAHFDNPPDSLLDSVAAAGAELWTMVHPETHTRVVLGARERGIRLLALDRVLDERGERVFGSAELTGRNGARVGLALTLARSGKSPDKVCAVVMGAGRCSAAAIRELTRSGVAVAVTPRRGLRDWLVPKLPSVDLLVSGVDLDQGDKGLGFLVSAAEVATMPQSAVVVDLTVDYAHLGPIETCRPTTATDPVYVDGGIAHACCWGWPDVTPAEASETYFSQLLDVIKRRRWSRAPKSS